MSEEKFFIHDPFWEDPLDGWIHSQIVIYVYTVHIKFTIVEEYFEGEYDYIYVYILVTIFMYIYLSRYI